MRGRHEIAVAINEAVQLAEQSGCFFFRQVKVHDPKIGSLTTGREGRETVDRAPLERFAFPAPNRLLAAA
jgi:hypothetical protein